MYEHNDEKFELALWRYGIISPLLHRDANDISLGELLCQASSKQYIHPYGVNVSFSTETLRKWRYRFLSSGLSGLTGKVRSDKGKYQIPDEIGSAMYAMREEHPRWTTAKIIIELTKTGKWDGRKPSRSALYRFTKASNLHKVPHINSGQKVSSVTSHKLWLRRLIQGRVTLDELKQDFSVKMQQKEIKLLRDTILKKPLRYRNRAICVFAVLRGIKPEIIEDYLFISRKTVTSNYKKFLKNGYERIVCDRRKTIKKHEDTNYINNIFSVIHSPPSLYGFNRTTWKQDDILKVMSNDGFKIGKGVLRRIIKNAGYKYRKARKVLTSNDPNYKEKLDKIKRILSNLGPNEKFFSIDEYGPFAIKMQGGKSLIPAGTIKTIPQWQKSKGSLIITAALELSTNQIVHFYSKKKDTDEMIKLLDILTNNYSNQECIYLSWDAASWHASKKLNERVDELKSNEFKAARQLPVVKLAPLPTCAQFLNVIESVFSGMARAIIHNSNYESVKKCQDAIDKYFDERNEYFRQHPKQAGNKIWGKEIVAPAFDESKNCKDPIY